MSELSKRGCFQIVERKREGKKKRRRRRYFSPNSKYFRQDWGSECENNEAAV